EIVDASRELVTLEAPALANREDERTELRHITALVESRHACSRRKHETELAPEVRAVALERLHGVAKHRPGEHGRSIARHDDVRGRQCAVGERAERGVHAAGGL